MGIEHENESLSRPAKEVWTFDWKVGSVLQGDCYRAERTADKDDVVIWLSREPLSGEQLDQFRAHVERLDSIRDWGDIECGIDSERRGFVALAHGSTKKIDFDQPGTIDLRNRFLTCVILVSQIHARGVGCGNITSGSFAIDSLGDIRFIGFLGGYGEKMSASVPLDIRVFSLLGDGIVGAPSVAADVYALAVMGLELFGAQFPPASINPRHMEEYIAKVRVDAPPWVLSVLATIVREPNRSFCKDAEELIRALEKSDTEYLRTIARKTNEGAQDDRVGVPITIDQIREKYVSAEELRKRRIAAIASSRYLKSGVVAFCAAVIISLFLSQLDTIQGLVPGTRALKRDREGKGNAATDVANALSLLRQADAPKGVGGRPARSAAISSGNIVETGHGSTQEQGGIVETETSSKLHLEPDNLILTGVVNRTVTSEEMSSILVLYDQLDDGSKARLAVAFVKAGGESERLFRDLLEKKTPRVLTAVTTRTKPLSTDALFLVAESRITPEVAQEWGRGQELSNDEVLWLAQVHARKRSLVTPFVAKLVLDRQVVPWPRSVFFQAMAQASERSGTPYEALIRGAWEEMRAADVHLILSWDDPLSTRVLYATLLLSSDAEILRTVMSGLLSKPLVEDALRIILEACVADGTESYENYAKIIGALGVADANSDAVLKDVLPRIRGDSKQDVIVSTLLEKGSISAIEIVLTDYGQSLHPDNLIDLLSRPETRVRKAVIPLLKGVRISSSRALIRERYDAEQDPEVRRLFERELFPSLYSNLQKE